MSLPLFGSSVLWRNQNITGKRRNKDYQSVLTYLEEYDEKEREKYQEVFCKNRARATVLAAYASRCGYNGIEFSLILVCKNTCVYDILFENGTPKNKKRDGIGVESIMSTAAKYDGVVDFSASEGVFVCQIILSNRKKRKN